MQLDSGLPVAWVAGDTVYGSSQKLRASLEVRKQAYALAVTCKEQVEVQGTSRRVDQVASSLAREEWQELSAGAESKGPRLFAWARMRQRGSAPLTPLCCILSILPTLLMTKMSF